MKKSKIKKRIPLPQVIKESEQLSDAEFKEQTRAYVPSAIARLAYLCNSNNENVSLGALKTLLAKNLPDLKATDITSGGDKIKGIDVVTLLKKAYEDTPRLVAKVHTDGEEK